MRRITIGWLMLAALWLGAAVPAMAQTITVSGCASLTTSGGTGVTNIVITCNQAAGGYIPPACSAPSITPVPNAAAPTSLTLNATCTPGSKPLTAVTAAGTSLTAGLPTTAPYPVTVGSIPVPTQTTKYVVAASDGTTTANAEVSYTPPSAPPPPPAGSLSCPGFTTTQYYDWDWGKGGLTIFTDVNSSNVRNALGPIGPNGIVVIGFTATGTAFGATGSVSIAPYPGDLASTTRTISISTSACDFTSPFPWVRTGDDVGVQFSVGAYVPRVYPALVAGTRYYINIATRDASGASSCASAGRACDMVIQASRP